VYEEYEWVYDGHHHLAIHGHQFDRFILNNSFLSGFNSRLHLHIQRLDFTGKWFSRLVDRVGTRWLRLSEKVAEGAVRHARLCGAERVFCGHTHAALLRDEDGVGYCNTGSWTDSTPTYVTVGREGVRIHEYHGRIGCDGPGENQTEAMIPEFELAIPG
jgi:UDP-2,3-diacylglucosamine pyrophosphatase LpxH